MKWVVEAPASTKSLKKSGSTSRLHKKHLSAECEFRAYIKSKLHGRYVTEETDASGDVIGWTFWETE